MKNAATEFQGFIDDIELVQMILVKLRPEMLEAINLPRRDACVPFRATWILLHVKCTNSRIKARTEGWQL
jgi:hypothetical protein